MLYFESNSTIELICKLKSLKIDDITCDSNNKILRFYGFIDFDINGSLIENQVKTVIYDQVTLLINEIVSSKSDSLDCIYTDKSNIKLTSMKRDKIENKLIIEGFTIIEFKTFWDSENINKLLYYSSNN